MSDIKVITFNKEGYDPFIDFLKGYSIFCVVFAHCLPVVLYDYTLFWVWGGMQVPMFVLIQVFHAYKYNFKPHIKFGKIFIRIIIPFVLVQGFIFSVYSFFSSESVYNILLSNVTYGGKGPGSYFFWIYIQIALILPLIGRFVFHTTKWLQLIIFLLFSIGFEVIFSILDLDDSIYRLLAIRYIFLIFLASQIWLKDGIKMDLKCIVFSIISIFSVFFFTYVQYDLEPFFYNTAWKNHRWINYYYVSSLMVFALWYVYKSIAKVLWMNKIVLKIGKCSYEIYLTQMIVFCFLPISKFCFISNPYLRVITYMSVTIVLCIVSGILFKELIMDRLLIKKNN